MLLLALTTYRWVTLVMNVIETVTILVVAYIVVGHVCRQSNGIDEVLRRLKEKDRGDL